MPLLKKKIIPILILLLSLSGSPSQAAHRSTSSEISNEWVFSGGMGLTFSPTLFLLSPQVEYLLHPHVLVGALIQAGIGDTSLITAGASLRYIIGNHPRFKPSIEGDFGITAASAGYAATAGNTSTFGIHAAGAIGFDYFIHQTMSLGTIFRVNFSPPVKTVFISWPLLTARFIL